MKKRTRDSRLVYAVMTGLNLCVAVMFSMALYPRPGVPAYESVVSAAPRDLIATETSKKAIVGIPTRVTVSSVGIDVPVRTGSYDFQSHTWTIDSQSAFYADQSVPVNDSNGTTLVYGHAEWGMFGRLPDIGPGATAVVYTKEGVTFTYTYESSQQVEPTDVSVLSVQGLPTLVLQTCSGAFDAYRTLVSFRLTGVVES